MSPMTSTATVFVCKLNTWLARLTRSRLTIAFLLFVLVNYAAQTALHSLFLSGVIQDRYTATGAVDSFGVRRGFTTVDHGVLEICYGVPNVHGTTCQTVVNHLPNVTNTLSVECAEGLTWLENYLYTTGIEQVAYLAFQFWLAMNSLCALSNESVPHLIVVLFAQVANMGWIFYRTYSGVSARNFYMETIVGGTCGHFDVLKGSWKHGVSFQYMDMIFGGIAALGTLYFFIKLLKLYLNATLSSVGSSPVINQLLKWRLWMRVFHVFSFFFVLTSALLWYVVRKRDTINPYFNNTLYDVGFYVVVIIVWPWVMLGSYSITKEKHLLFLVYAILSICLLLISGLWFGSALYRYEYVAWRFFACMTTIADVLLVGSYITSIVCRINFGKGVAQFLNVEQALQASGFAQDTFLRDPSRPGKERLFTSNSPEPRPQPVLKITRPSFETLSLKHKYLSAHSVSVPSVCTTWSSTQGTGPEDEDKWRLQPFDSAVMIFSEGMSIQSHSVCSSVVSDEKDVIY